MKTLWIDPTFSLTFFVKMYILNRITAILRVAYPEIIILSSTIASRSLYLKKKLFFFFNIIFDENPY